ncbi:MAG: phosphatidylserine/phosphatidylglycerophosphate/cardiolipin synthase family protein [Phormidesmis sp.]
MMSLIITLFKWLLGAFLGFIAMVLVILYIRGAFRWRSLFHIKQALPPDDPRFAAALKSLSASIEATGSVVDFWDTPDKIQSARLAAINRATQSIQFETFMMTPGRRADDFADAIAKKCAEGVKVQLLVDSWGARSLNKKYWQRLGSVGAEVVFFNPFDWRAPANYAGRTHRKLLIIDSQLALIGGAGVSNLWDGTEKADDTSVWFDIEFSLVGDVVGVFSTLFQAHWQGHKTDNKVTHIDMALMYPAKTNLAKTNLAKTEPAKTDPAKQENAFSSTMPMAGTPSTVLVTPGTKPNYRDSPIETIKQTLIASAQKRIWLSSPYFLPNMSTRKLLIEAKKSGLDVRILTTSDRSDKKPVYYASYEVYGPLLEAGVQIFEYRPSMLHAKMLMIDDRWTNTGSANLDYRSFLHNDELDIVTNNKQLFNKIEQTFEKGFSQSEQITLRQWQRRSWLKHRILGNAVRLVQWQL